MTLFLFLTSFFFFSLSMKINSLEFYFFINFIFIKGNSNPLCLIFDFYSIFFCFTVILISMCIFYYSWSYMDKEIYKKRFFIVLFSFVLSMIFLIFSANLITAMVGWDGLGLTSLLLIIYYMSQSSFQAGLMTFLCNRIGDIFLILSICLLFFFSSEPLISLTKFFPFEISFFMLMTSITKSAQFPFSAWLPAAMAAPTPVSSLVHSSTLVTAGVYLLFRFSSIWEKEENLKMILSFLALITLIMAASSALSSWDMKKIIAFSTLSQLSMMMYSLSCNLLILTFFHLIIHAYIKALLFMIVGYLIHGMNNFQDIRKMGILFNSTPILSSCLIFSSLSLCGFPFLSGFYSKDLIIDNILEKNFSFKNIIFLIYMFSTLVYSFRLLNLIFNVPFLNYFSLSDKEMKMIKPMMILMIFSSLSGSCLSWKFVLFSPSSFLEKFFCLIMILLIPLISWYLVPMMSKFFIFSHIWFLNELYMKMSFPIILFFKLSMNLEKTGFFSFIHFLLKNFLFENKKTNWLPMSKMSMSMEFFFYIFLISIFIQFNC